MTMRTIWVKFKTVTSMKKIFTKAMLVAAAAMAFFACQKQEVNAPEEVKVEGLNFSAEKPEFADASKTEWTGSEIHWSKGDAIRVAYTCNGVWQDASGNPEQGKYGKLYASDPLSETTDVATFVVPGDFKGSEQGDYKFYGIYPSTLTSSTDLSSAPSVSIDIPSEQTPAANSFYAKADVMVAQSDIYKGIPKNGEKNGSISLKWNRLVAHGHITLKSLPVDGQEVVKSIVLTADAEADMVGKHKVNFNTQEVEKDGSNATNSITINGTNLTIDANGNVTFWACFLPCTWNSISVSVETDKATYTLERNLVELNKIKTFAKNARNVLAINMAEANRAGKVVVDSDYAGTYVILAQRGLNYYYLTGVETTSATPRLTAVDAGTTLPEAELETEPSKVWNLVKTNGKYLLQSAQGEYVAYTKNGDNSADMASEGVVFDVVKNEDTYQFTLTDKNGEKRFLSLNNNTGNDYFALYKEGQKMDLCLIPAEVGEVPPVINATAPEEMAAAGGNGSFTFSITNPVDGKEVNATTDVDWITDVIVGNEQVSYTVSKNTGAARSAEITLSYEGAASKKVTVTQAAAEQSGGSEGVETVVEIVASDLGIDNGVSVGTLNDGLLVFAKGGNPNGNDPKYYNSGTNIRMYEKNTLTVTAPEGNVLTSIIFSISGSYDNLSASTGNYQNGSWSGNSDQVVFTNTSSSQTRFTKIVITYMSLPGTEGGETPEPGEPETPVEPTLTPRNLTFSAATATATVGQAFTAPTLSGVTTGVTYSSSNTAVATVDASSGVVNLVGAGTTTIKASALATDQYEAGEATYTLTVSPATSGNATITITLDMSKNIFGLSTAKANAATSEISKTYEGYTYKFKATDSFYYYGSKATLIGKANSYITFPAIEGYKLTSVEAHNCVGASAKGSIVICSTSNTTAVSGGTASTIAAGGSKTWTLSGTAVNTAYRFYITNANAVQLTKMVLTYKKN